MNPSFGDPAWPINQDQYAGWIPCITGQLSYSLIGRAAGFQSANLEVGEKVPHRFIAVHQHRTSTDLPYDKRLVEWRLPWSTIDFFMIGETAASQRAILHSNGSHGCADEDDPTTLPEKPVTYHDDDIGVLRGEIYAFVHFDSKNLNRRKNQIVHQMKRVIIKGEARDANTYSRRFIDEFSNTLYDLLIQAGSLGVPPVKFGFNIYRTGEIRIDSANARSYHYIKRNLDKDVNEIVESFSKQVFYFCKDVTHRHYHHHHHSDNILPLKSATPDDDHTWRRETLWSLVRAALNQRRSELAEDQKHALGILAYAEAFQRNLANIVRDPENFRKHRYHPCASDYDFEHTRQSLTSRYDVNKSKDDDDRWRAGSMISWALAGVGIYEALRRSNENASPPRFYVEISEAIISNPLLYGAITWALLLVTLELFRVGIVSRRSKTGKFIDRLTISIGASLSRALSNAKVTPSDTAAATIAGIASGLLGVLSALVSLLLAQEQLVPTLIRWLEGVF